MKKTNPMLRLLLAAALCLVSLAGTFSAGYAEDSGDLTITVTPVIQQCGEVQFTISWTPAEADSYLFFLDFGDGDSTSILTIDAASTTISHTYLDQGDYEINVQVAETDQGGLSGNHTEILTLDGPDVTLSSSPFPPMFVAGDEGLVNYTVEVNGGTPPYQYQWDLDGDGTPEAYSTLTPSFTYSEVGQYTASVTVTDGCQWTSTDSLPVVVADEEDACHPMAQKIADGLSSLLPEKTAQDYNCEDIYALFDNEAEENNLGFGRMWMAYKLAQNIDLTWEDILAWHLDQTGWGSLLQLDRFAEVLDEQGIGDLMALVMSEDYTLSDVRTAVRSVTRYEADFDDALTRIADGATAGELSQLYSLAADLEVDPTELDPYLADGMTLPELKHAASFADRMEVDWTEIAEDRVNADSWGDLKQAYTLANDEYSPAEILAMGVQEYRKLLQEDQKAEKQDQQAQKAGEKSEQTANKLAEQFSAEFGDVMSLYNGECLGDWACVRSALREQSRTMAEGLSEKDYQTAMQIAAKYGVSQEEVLEYHQEFCSADWACTRSYFRNMYMETRETGKAKH